MTEGTRHENARDDMSPKQAKKKPTVTRPAVKPEGDPLGYEMWLTEELTMDRWKSGALRKISALMSFNVEDSRSGREARH